MISIPIKKLIKDLELEVIYSPDNVVLNIKTSDINRPGLQLAGFFDYFAFDRLQALGKVEMTYLNILNPDVREFSLNEYFSYDIPCIIVSRNMEIPDYLEEAARKFKKPLLRTSRVTTNLIHSLTMYLDDLMAPRITQHGVLVDVYGVGVFLTGESGIGKSETALELIKRGHMLIADDAVEIFRLNNNILVGEAPKLIRHFMEIRGIGIIDIRSMYGVGAVLDRKEINLEIYLEFWDRNKEYDRLGLEEEYTELLGVKLQKLVLPVRPGRNLAIVLEVAARNWRQKAMGYNAAQELDKRLNALLLEGSDE